MSGLHLASIRWMATRLSETRCIAVAWSGGRRTAGVAPTRRPAARALQHRLTIQAARKGQIQQLIDIVVSPAALLAVLAVAVLAFALADAAARWPNFNPDESRWLSRAHYVAALADPSVRPGPTST